MCNVSLLVLPIKGANHSQLMCLQKNGFLAGNFYVFSILINIQIAISFTLSNSLICYLKKRIKTL
jgi:hypothetical protein